MAADFLGFGDLGLKFVGIINEMGHEIEDPMQMVTTFIFKNDHFFLLGFVTAISPSIILFK